MSRFEYGDSSHPVRENIGKAHRQTWERLAGPGSWWTGAQRVAVAAEVRGAYAGRNDPPWLRGEPPERDGILPVAAREVARRVAVDAQKIDRAWCDRMLAALGDAAYVELVGVAVCTIAVDAFAEALGVAPEPLPAARAGEPQRVRPDGTAEAGAFVPMTVPWQGPNVARALTLAPGEWKGFLDLVDAMYGVTDFTKLVWDRPLSRPQVEVVASRVSAVNECFY